MINTYIIGITTLCTNNQWIASPPSFNNYKDNVLVFNESMHPDMYMKLNMSETIEEVDNAIAVIIKSILVNFTKEDKDHIISNLITSQHSDCKEKVYSTWFHTSSNIDLEMNIRIQTALDEFLKDDFSGIARSYVSTWDVSKFDRYEIMIDRQDEHLNDYYHITDNSSAYLLRALNTCMYNQSIATDWCDSKKLEMIVRFIMFSDNISYKLMRYKFDRFVVEHNHEKLFNHRYMDRILTAVFV